MAEQIKIADRVEHLVLDEFVVVTQAVTVEHAVFVEHHGVVQSTAERQTVFAQPFDLLHEAEGAGAGHFTGIGVLGKVDEHFLPGAVDRRVIEGD